MQNKLEDELDQLSDEEIEKRLAAAFGSMTSVPRFCVTSKKKSSAGRKRPN